MRGKKAGGVEEMEVFSSATKFDRFEIGIPLLRRTKTAGTSLLKNLGLFKSKECCSDVSSVFSQPSSHLFSSTPSSCFPYLLQQYRRVQYF